MKKVALVVVLGMALVVGSMTMAGDANAWRVAYCGPVYVAPVAVVAPVAYCAPVWCAPYPVYTVKYKKVRGWCW